MTILNKMPKKLIAPKSVKKTPKSVKKMPKVKKGGESTSKKFIKEAELTGENPYIIFQSKKSGSTSTPRTKKGSGSSTIRKVIKGVALTGATLTAAYYLNKYLEEQKLKSLNQKPQQVPKPQILQMVEVFDKPLPPPPAPQMPPPPVPSKTTDLYGAWSDGNSLIALKNIRHALNKLNISIGDETKDNICKSYDKIINEPRKRCFTTHAYPKEQDECVKRFLKKTDEQVNLEEYKKYLKMFGC